MQFFMKVMASPTEYKEGRVLPNTKLGQVVATVAAVGLPELSNIKEGFIVQAFPFPDMGALNFSNDCLFK